MVYEGAGMKRTDIIATVGSAHLCSNHENDEYSYVRAAGGKRKLQNALGRKPAHEILDIRFESNGVVVLVETKVRYTKKDQEQLKEYVDLEKAVHHSNKIIAILANTRDNKLGVWKSEVDDDHKLANETVLDSMVHYESLFAFNPQNDREKVLKNTSHLNETLNKMDIAPNLRSQFVGTILLDIRETIKRLGITDINSANILTLKQHWQSLTPEQIRAGIEVTLKDLLKESTEVELKIRLLQSNVLENSKVKNLKKKNWLTILDEIVTGIYPYINPNSSEGQDILNLFFTAFNKYSITDKNQAFTPDHIAHFMCRVTDVDCTKRVFDGTCGSGSFLVQAMVLELADCSKQKLSQADKKKLEEDIKKHHIYGVEIEDTAFGLATTNMLIHGDGNSNVIKDNLFHCEDFIRRADPDIILMNPPYNAVPINIPLEYQAGWGTGSKFDPTKGLIFLKFLSDVLVNINKQRLSNRQPKKEIKLAILLPVAVAKAKGGNKDKQIVELKKELLEENTLEAVFSLPVDVFYPGTSVTVCCMVFTLGRSHKRNDGTTHETFFGYFRDDSHKKKKNLGRIERFDSSNKSLWKQTEELWLDLFRNKKTVDGLSAKKAVSGTDEWLCEAYMKTDYSKLTQNDFQQTVNNFLAYLVKEGRTYESN